ncbi:MAG: sporulation transcriptional regulator SpoIIID [Intestinibacillus sp.]
MKGLPEERAIRLAQYIIEQEATVRQAAAQFGISKSTVHTDVSKWNRNGKRAGLQARPLSIAPDVGECRIYGRFCTRLFYPAAGRHRMKQTGKEGQVVWRKSLSTIQTRRRRACGPSPFWWRRPRCAAHGRSSHVLHNGEDPCRSLLPRLDGKGGSAPESAQPKAIFRGIRGKAGL